MNLPNDANLNKLLFSKEETVLGAFIPDYLMTTFSKKTLDWKKSFSLYPGTSVHETTHWHQFMGTTWGCMWTILNQCRANEFINTKHYFDLNKVLREIKQINVKPDYSMKYNRWKVSHKVLVFAQNWLDLTLSSKFFKDGCVDFLQYSGLRDSIANGLSDYTTTVLEYFDEEVPFHVLETGRLFSFDDFCFVRDHQVGIVSTLDLLEGHAKANEMIHLMSIEGKLGEISKGEFIKNFTGERLPNVYKKALDVYFRLNGMPDINNSFFNRYVEEMAKFCTIIDISLAIPIPPFIPFSEIKQLNWKAISPPFRFLNLCDVASSIKFDFDVENINESSQEFANVLCRKLNYKTPTELSKYFISTYKHKLNKLENIWKNVRFDERSLHIHDYYFHVFSNFHQLRVNNLNLASNYGFSVSGYNNENTKNQNNKYIELITNVGREDNHWYYAPLQTNGERKLLSNPHYQDGFTDWLLYWITQNQILNEHVLFRRPIKTDSFMFNVSPQRKKFIIETINRNYDLKLSWD